jgi:hypothetical protein
MSIRYSGAWKVWNGLETVFAISLVSSANRLQSFPRPVLNSTAFLRGQRLRLAWFQACDAGARSCKRRNGAPPPALAFPITPSLSNISFIFLRNIRNTGNPSPHPSNPRHPRHGGCQKRHSLLGKTTFFPTPFPSLKSLGEKLGTLMPRPQNPWAVRGEQLLLNVWEPS